MMKVRSLLLISCFFLLSGCASVPKDPAEAEAYYEANDPLEPFNRKIFAFNMAADKYVLRPVTDGYRAITTVPFRTKVRTFLGNLKTPLTVVNDILQLNLKNAGLDLSRFIINSTLGFFGVFDVADRMGIAPNSQNFGTTMAVWNVPSGPYLVLPFLGPSNVRDATGLAGDVFLDPFYYAGRTGDNDDVKRAFWSADGVNAVAAYENVVDLLDEGKKNSLDFYAYMRSMYQQHRKKTIQRAKGTNASDNAKVDYGFALDDDDDDEEE